MDKKKLFLVDGYSLLYRSYYAIRQLTNSKGFATNAIYGFMMALRKIIDREKPHYLGIAFDSKGPTIRHEIFEEYKATRKPMPDDLIPQISVLKKLIEALNIPFYEKPGYEGDDILGSLAHKASHQNLHTVIMSHDKDLFQLVDETTSILHLAKDILMTENEVKKTFGVLPSQIVDVQALWGDPTDNIPGVAGVGEKTAKNLINQFGSVDKLLENLDEVKNPRIRKQIEEGKEKLELSRSLVTLVKDLDIDLDLEALAVSEPDYEKLIPLLHELEFSSLLSEYLQESKKQPTQYHIIWKEEQLQHLIERITKTKQVSLDTETDSPYPTQARLVGISFSIKPHEAFYLPLQHDYPEAPAQIPKNKALKLLKKTLTSPKIKKIGQNIKYDYIVLRREGIILQGTVLDSMVLSYLINPNWGKHNLGRLALAYLQVKATPYEDIVGKGKNQVTMDEVAIEKVAPYACQDADLALQLSLTLEKKAREDNLYDLFRDIELPLIEILANMEIWGIKASLQILRSLSAELNDELVRLQAKIFDHSGEEFNINSPQQLAHILFEKLKLPSSRKTKKTREYSTSMDVLQELAPSYPIAQYTLEYRQLTKLKSTYADALPRLINPETQRIHTSYNQTVVATGRLSSSDPNLQNIPVRGEWGTRFRQAFIPENDCLFLSADYSQIELRVLAHLSGDPAFIDTFLHDRDIHQETANQVFGGDTSLFKEETRRKAKIINFSMIYGASAFSLARELGTSNSEAQEFIDIYFDTYPKVREFLEKCVQDAIEKGFAETLFGRRRPVPELKQINHVAQQTGRRIALNAPIQGTAADLMKKAMIDIWSAMKEQNLKSKMILQVHDELVFEVPEPEHEIMESIVKEKMENVVPLKIPLNVHLGWGVNWSEAK